MQFEMTGAGFLRRIRSRVFVQEYLSNSSHLRVFAQESSMPSGHPRRIAVKTDRLQINCLENRISFTGNRWTRTVAERPEKVSHHRTDTSDTSCKIRSIFFERVYRKNLRIIKVFAIIKLLPGFTL